MAKNGSLGATLSGTVINQGSAGTTVYFLYPGACQQRALGTWAPVSAEQADSMDTYTEGGTGGYGVADQSVKERLWHVVNSSVPAGQRPAILAGTASLWCGKYDPNWVVQVGYPNTTFQILYIDTGAHAGSYTLTYKANQSSEIGYDYVYLIGGDPTLSDAMQNSRAKFDEATSSGASGGSDLLVTWTGSILTTTPGATNPPIGSQIIGDGAAQPSSIVPVTINMPSNYRDIYFLFTADCGYSSEDGNWPNSHGQIFDDVTCSDNGVIFGDGTAPSGSDAWFGDVLQGTYGSQGYIAARVAPGTGELWQIVNGGFSTTADNCQLQKNDTADRMFFGADASSKKTIAGQWNSIISCTFPVPVGTAELNAFWGEYLDLPRGAGFVQDSEYRFYKGGVWSNWQDTDPDGGVITSVIKTWLVDGGNLASAVQADSVQIRYDLRCITAFATDRITCGQLDYGILYDDFYLQVLSGIPAPLISSFPSAVPQTMFVDGTMTGLNCTTPPCWPGTRGTNTPSAPAGQVITDNVNSPYGDSLWCGIATGLRKNGMGVNWHNGYSKLVNGGRTLAFTNATFVPAYDTPRAIYRLFDPTSQSWSAFDSTEMAADNIQISGADTVNAVAFGAPAYRWDWPPIDKAGQNLPGGFTINGVGAYNNLAFLPRGTRMQFYFKGVDINGGRSYIFGAGGLPREVEDLPTLPGGSIVAPDIMEMDVLPRKYAVGSGTSLLAGKTNTPVLNLDGSYSVWSFGQDPVTQALRGMGVRADRYRLTQGLDNADNFGGHELLGPPDNQRAARSSNYFPNLTEYGILDSLSKWYRIVIQSGHTRTATLEDESDSRLLEAWWAAETPGSNGGDRCVFVSGDDYFNALLNIPAGEASSRRISYGQNVLGVNSASGAWVGANAVPYPTVEDRFSAPGAGPGLVTGYTYPVDGGCPGPNRFDALTKIGASTAQNIAFYPIFSGITDVAGVANMTERDAVTDHDRNKALGYGFSIQFVRKAGIPTNAANYVRSGVQERMQILYKFLASCRGPRSGAAGDTSVCWPCPTDANMTGNWATLTGFQTGSYGPLYPIQDNLAATGVEVSDASAAPKVNKLEGNYPNPFNPQTTIKFTAAQAGKVTLRIFNVGGQLVRTLTTKAEVGPNEVRWNGKRDDGAQLASGVYFYKVRFVDGTETGSRMALVK
ncbi:MAG TPA: FlgD immunoglobulin-like domain containing protein [Candidatus Eisenbacteria bacterium]